MITTKSKSYEEQVKLFAEHIKEAGAIVVGAASGMSAAAGYRHYYERDKDFVENLGDFEKKYGYHNSFDGFYYHYRTSEEQNIGNCHCISGRSRTKTKCIGIHY